MEAIGKLVAAGALLVASAAPALSQVAIRAETFFVNVSDRVVIQTASNQKLVFDEQFGSELILNGNSLAIYADNVEVIGTVTIRAFPTTAAAPPNGGVGSAGARGGDAGGGDRDGPPGGNGGAGGQGPTGASGAPSGDVVLGIKSLSGTGTLRIALGGEAGGKGGQGGRGGDGGSGGPGHNRDGCNAFCGGCRAPGNGGTGGTGGRGGTGGVGGRGGAGGTITYSDSLLQAIDVGRLAFDLSPAPGGAGGEGGPPGNGGPGGGMGHGNQCGGGGQNGSPGGGGAGGDKGSAGSPGAPPKPICFGPSCP